MSSAGVLDTVSRLPGMSGKANDAVPAFTHGNMSDASILFKLPEM